MGTEAFWIPAVMAAVGTGAEFVNQKQANQRQNDSEIQAMQHQQALQDKGTAAARGLTEQIAQDTPTQIQNKATGDYVSTLRKNAVGSTQGGSTTKGDQTFGASTSALAPVAGASSRYSDDTAKSQQEVQRYGDTAAGEMGAIDAATRMRQNEGLAMGTLSTHLNTLGAQSYGQNFVDQLRAQASGQTNPWVSLASGLVKNGANAYATNAKGKVPVNQSLMPGSGGYNRFGAPLDAGNPGYGGGGFPVA
jgi:hypothetical protein